MKWEHKIGNMLGPVRLGGYQYVPSHSNASASWNGMTKVAHWEIPTGSTIYQGKAAMQFPWLGSKTQYFGPELGNIKRVIK
jgi:hypothetical protein